MSDRTPERVAIVTAASRGIGAGCARALAAAGYRTVLLARSAEIEQLASELNGRAVVGSVTEERDLRRAVDVAVDTFGRIDVVVTNTGHPPKGPLLELADGDWSAGYELLLLPVIRIARLVTPVMKRQEGGSIVNLSSLWAVEPHKSAPISSTFRAALSAYTKLFSDQHAAAKVRMNCVLSGFVDTHEVPPHILEAIPTGRPATPDEIGQFVVFLASPQASYITGQSIRIDGGLTRSV